MIIPRYLAYAALLFCAASAQSATITLSNPLIQRDRGSTSAAIYFDVAVPSGVQFDAIAIAFSIGGGGSFDYFQPDLPFAGEWGVEESRSEGIHEARLVVDNFGFVPGGVYTGDGGSFLGDWLINLGFGSIHSVPNGEYPLSLTSSFGPSGLYLNGELVDSFTFAGTNIITIVPEPNTAALAVGALLAISFARRWLR